MSEENINTVIHCPSRDHLLTLLCRRILGVDPVFEEDNKEQKTMNTETNRSEFEEWALSAGYWLHTNPYDDTGKYYDSSDTESAWEAWQAAREQKNEPEPAKEVTNKKVRLYGWSHGSDCWQWSGEYESEEEAENAIKLWRHNRKYYKIEPY